MKAKSLWILFLAGALVGTACRHYQHNTMTMDDGKTRVQVRFEGEIEFTDDETAIAKITPGGFLEYRSNEDHLMAGINDKGVLEVDLARNGKDLDPASAEGRELVRKAIRNMIGMGFDLDGRMDRIYRKGGYPALLSAADSTDGDYIRGRYLERVLDGDSISAGLVEAAVTRIRERVNSDYDKQRLLEKIDTIYLLNDSVCADYLAAVKTIHGDYEKSEALKHFLVGTVPVRQYTGVLDAAATVGGNYERSNVLKELIDQPLAEGRPFDSLLRVVGEMNGDYEKGQLLKQIITKDIKDGGSWAGLIRTTRTLGGEYERSEMLIQIGQRLPKVDSLKTLYMDAAKTVHSDNDYGRVVKAVSL